jgi:hypothetical protein
MSHNLKFIKGKKSLGFPFQTPTHVTEKVMKAFGNDRKMDILHQTLVDWGWNWKERHDAMQRIIECFADDQIELVST